LSTGLYAGQHAKFEPVLRPKVHVACSGTCLFLHTEVFVTASMHCVSGGY
jgi:hypothetical protein